MQRSVRYIRLASTGSALAATFVALLSPSISRDAKAGVLDDLLGGSNMIEDAGAQAQAAITNARAAGEALIAQGSAAAAEQLAEVDRIVDDAVQELRQLAPDAEEAALNVLNTLKRDLTELEEELVGDLNNLIWTAHCASKQILVTDLQTALGDFGRLIGTHTIRIEAPIPDESGFLCSWTGMRCEYFRDFPVKTPFSTTYQDVRAYMLASIGKLGENDSAATVVNTYTFLSQFSMDAICLAGRTEMLARDHARFLSLAQEWEMAMTLEVPK